MSQEIKSNTVGLVSFILALVGVVLGWIPLIGWGIVIAAFVLGLIGLKHPREKGLAIAGVVISSVVMVIGIILILLFAVSSDSTETYHEEAFANETIAEKAAMDPSETEDEVESEPKDESIEKESYKIGETVELEGKQLTVTKVEKSDGASFDQAKNGKEYVIVTVEIVNNSDKEISYNTFDFEMKNSMGQIQNMAFTIVDSDTSLESGSLTPGGTVSGTIAFEQPKDDPELQLQYEVSFWANKRILVDLQ